MATQKRIRCIVQPSPKKLRLAHPWMVKIPLDPDPDRPSNKGWIISSFPTQGAAIAAAVKSARARWEAGRLSEVIIKGRDGKIRDSRTYGRDPRKTKG